MMDRFAVTVDSYIKDADHCPVCDNTSSAFQMKNYNRRMCQSKALVYQFKSENKDHILVTGKMFCSLQHQ